MYLVPVGEMSVHAFISMIQLRDEASLATIEDGRHTETANHPRKNQERWGWWTDSSEPLVKQIGLT